MFYFMMHSKHFYFGYIASNILDKDTQITREKTVPLRHGLFFLINSKGSFMCTIL